MLAGVRVGLDKVMGFVRAMDTSAWGLFTSQCLNTFALLAFAANRVLFIDNAWTGGVLRRHTCVSVY